MPKVPALVQCDTRNKNYPANLVHPLILLLACMLQIWGTGSLYHFSGGAAFLLSPIAFC